MAQGAPHPKYKKHMVISPPKLGSRYIVNHRKHYYFNKEGRNYENGGLRC